MLYIDSIWEYIVNFLELALFIIFIHKKLRIRANYKHQAVLMFLFVSFQFAVLCTLNKMGISSYSTLMSSCVLDIGYAVLFYRDSIIRRIFWGFSYSIICLVAEQISFFIPVTLYKGASLELLLGGTLRKPYTMLYLAMIAVFVLLFHSIGNKDISLSPFQKVAYIFIAISGLAIGHYILRLTLESVDKFGDSSFSARLSLVDLFFIILFLVLMLYIYQLGYSKEENIRLLEEQKIYELERTEFNSLSETTERLRKMKHDMQIYVDADACPVVDIVEKIAKKYQISVTLLCDTNHILTSGYSEVVVVGAGADAVDYKLISLCRRGDIVVTQDYGVAAMTLGKSAYAIHQSGKWYTDDNIDQMLMERHLNKKARRSSRKCHVKGPKKRTEEDDERFAQSFEKMLLMAREKEGR